MSTPAEIKAQAVVLVVLGKSCREAREELRRQFPEAHIPHYSTIAVGRRRRRQQPAASP